MKVTKKFIVIVLILILFILSACNNYDNDADRIEMYILRHVEGSNDFIIDENPIFTGEDILKYKWKTHTITFKEEFLSSRTVNEAENNFVMGGSQILGVYYPDQFALYLDGVELYRGHIEPQAFISFMPMGPMISNAPDGILIKCYDDKSDVRDNEKLHEVLKNNGLLR